MAKTIKFNLILDDYPVRSLEGLQEHFSIEDILKFYENGLLEKWLSVRGYEKQLQLVQDISEAASKKEIIRELIKIFDIALEEKEIEEQICILDFLEKEKVLYEEYKKNSFEKKQILADYHVGYDALIQHMIDNKDNMAVLKADVSELEKEYLGLFALDYHTLFFRLNQEAPKAVFAMLTKKVFRKYWIDRQYWSERDKRSEVYSYIKKNYAKKEKIKEVLEDDLKIVQRDTQAMWDPIERKGTKLMILSTDIGAFIKNAEEFEEKIPSSEVEGAFLLFDGLEYQCNNSSYELLYMEV